VAAGNLAFSSNVYWNPHTPPRFNLFAANGGDYGQLGDSYDLAGWRALGYDAGSIVADPLLDGDSFPRLAAARGAGRRPEGAPAPSDFDGDRSSDVAIFRPSEARWLGGLSGGTVLDRRFGAPDLVDIPVGADYDGDGVADLAVFRPAAAQWFIAGSTAGPLTFRFGDTDLVDIPVPADYDGDGVADLAVFRPATADWFLLRSTAGPQTFRFGDTQLRDVPIPADYDGDGKVDLAVFRPASADWFIVRSTAGPLSFKFGDTQLRDIPAPADYDGDGKADLAVFRPADGSWLTIRSSAGPRTFKFGDTQLRDLPLTAPVGALVSLRRVGPSAVTSRGDATGSADGRVTRLVTAATTMVGRSFVESETAPGEDAPVSSRPFDSWKRRRTPPPWAAR
jgi:hypothetical protein